MVFYQKYRDLGDEDEKVTSIVVCNVVALVEGGELEEVDRDGRANRPPRGVGGVGLSLSGHRLEGPMLLMGRIGPSLLVPGRIANPIPLPTLPPIICFSNQPNIHSLLFKYYYSANF